MPTFLTDPATGVYLILIAFALVAGVIAARNQDRRSLIRFGLAVALLLLLFALDRSSESPREEAVRRIQAMAAAADVKNPDAFVEHIADRFEYVGGPQPVMKTREELKTSGFWPMLRSYNVHVAVWDFAREDVRQTDASTVEIGFMAKGEAEGKPYPIYIRATFGKQPDGRYLMTRFATFHPANHAEALAIPNF